MKKFIFLIIAFLLFSCSVKASSFYTNDNGVSFSEDEYSFVSKMVYDGYQSTMTIDEYNYFFINNQNAKNGIDLYNVSSNSYESKSKILKISYNCNSECLITITLTWKKMPLVRSYDIIGAYISSGNYKSFWYTKIVYDNISTKSTTVNEQNNGLGSSIKLPSTQITNLNIVQSFYVSKSGTVYASYQHAKKAINYANSNSYVISKNGMGNVFLFNNAYGSYYDNMNGVSINL